MVDSGVDMYSTTLGRNLSTDDLFLCNSITDLAGFLAQYGIDTMGCSSLSSWGTSTMDDPQLNGDIVITRNMDWSSNAVLQSNHLMVINFPSEVNEMPWLSMCFPGMIGSLSGINIAGTSAFMNVGNINNAGTPGNLHPIFLSIRNGIEVIDYDDDGITSKMDVFAAIDDKIHYGASIVHCVTNPEAFIVEVNNENGTILRTITDNYEVSGDNLVATNHFRTLYDPIYCYRYAAFVDSLDDSNLVSLQRNWDISTNAGGVNNNLHTMQYAPTLNRLAWSTTTAGIPAYLREPTIFDLNQWFEEPVNSDNGEFPSHPKKMAINPNPAIDETTIQLLSKKRNTNYLLAIYNLKGQLITKNELDNRNEYHWDLKDKDNKDVAPGIYLIRITLQGEMVAGGKIIAIK